MERDQNDKTKEIKKDSFLITSDQIRAARALLRWSADVLAKQSGLGIATVRRMELADGVPSASAKNLAAVQTALEDAGVVFIAPSIEGEGVRFRLPPGQRNRG